MQSIYGFRQAEVRAFLELAEDGIGEVQFDVQRLRSNFRSAKPWSIGSTALLRSDHAAPDDRERGAIAFRPSEAALPPASRRGAGPCAVRGVSRAAAKRRCDRRVDRGAPCRRHPEWRDRRAGARQGARARDRASSCACEASLSGRGHRAAAGSPGGARFGHAHLCGIAASWRSHRVAGVLRAPWAGLSLGRSSDRGARRAEHLGCVCDDAVLSELVARTAGQRCLTPARTLEAAFRNRHSRHGGTLGGAALVGLGGPASFPGADDLEPRCHGTSRACGNSRAQGLPDPADLVRSFSDLYAEHRAEASVEIMTIHKSKGLEFDLVVVPALDRHMPGNRSQLLLSHQFARTGRSGLVMAASPGWAARQDRLVRLFASSKSRCGEPRGGAPAVRGLHPSEVAAASHRDHGECQRGTRRAGAGSMIRCSRHVCRLTRPRMETASR
jgi:ATP-dependent helicase/nuclease subunit A